MKTLVQCVSQRETIINTEKEATVRKLSRDLPQNENKLWRNLNKIRGLHEENISEFEANKSEINALDDSEYTQKKKQMKENELKKLMEKAKRCD